MSSMTTAETFRRRRRDTHIFAKDPDGFYVEPQWCSVRLFEVESFGAKGALIFDPAAGWGRVLQAAAGAGYNAIGSDIVNRGQSGKHHVNFYVCDFLKDYPVTSVGSVVTNPPFNYVEQFAVRALAIAKFKVAMLVPLRRLPAARWLEHMPLETIHLLAPRPSMPPGAWIAAGNTPGGGGQDFCWLVMNKMMKPAAPRLRWLHRDESMKGRQA